MFGEHVVTTPPMFTFTRSLTVRLPPVMFRMNSYVWTYSARTLSAPVTVVVQLVCVELAHGPADQRTKAAPGVFPRGVPSDATKVSVCPCGIWALQEV